MTRKEALEALLAKVEAGTCSNDGIMYRSFGDDWTHCFDAYNGSLDAVKALHGAMLPEWSLDQFGERAGGWIATLGRRDGNSVRPAPTAMVANNPARAWLMAIIKALISMEPREKGGDE